MQKLCLLILNRRGTIKQNHLGSDMTQMVLSHFLLEKKIFEAVQQNKPALLTEIWKANPGYRPEHITFFVDWAVDHRYITILRRLKSYFRVMGESIISQALKRRIPEEFIIELLPNLNVTQSGELKDTTRIWDLTDYFTAAGKRAFSAILP